VKGRKWFGLLPAQFKEYTFFVGNTPHRFRVPAEFQMDAVLQQPASQKGHAASFELRPSPGALGLRDVKSLPVIPFSPLMSALATPFLWIASPTISESPKWATPLSFAPDQILDAVGKATGRLHAEVLHQTARRKRGRDPGNQRPHFARGWQPRDEVPPFERNAAQEGEYVGYKNVERLATGREMEVPEDSFVALGDNSANSA
jgi:hypothetical protein